MQNTLSVKLFCKQIVAVFVPPYQFEILLSLPQQLILRWILNIWAVEDRFIPPMCCGFLLSDKKFVTASFMSPNLAGVITELTTGWWATPPCPTQGTTNGTRSSGQSSTLSWYSVSLDLFYSGRFCCWGAIYFF